MAKAVSFHPDDGPARFVYTDSNGNREEYEYRKVMGRVNGENLVQQVYVPVDQKAKEPPEMVLRKMEDHDLEVHPESRVEIEQELSP